MRDFFEGVLNYLFQAARHLDKGRIEEALKQALPQFTDEGEVAMATIAQNLRAEGMAQGLARGMEQGRAEGEARGMEQGRAEGMARGFEQHARQTLQRQLSHKFGPLPDHLEQRIEQAGQPQLDHWLDQVLDATSLEKVFS